MNVAQLVRRLATTSFILVAGLSATAYASGHWADEQAPGGSILYAQTHVDASASADGTALYRAPAAGGNATRLLPLAIGTLDLGARWSGYRGAIVFERVTTADWFTQSQLYLMDRDAGRLRQITVGKSRHQLPVWGPGNWIAYVDGGVDSHQCLAVVRPDGDDQHVLFCPGQTDAVFQLPQWSRDGRELFAEVHYYGDTGVNPPVYSDVYKVNVATGKATRISHLDIGDVAHLAISPDGTRGVYAWDATSAMAVVNFATGTMLGSEFGGLSGSSPTWSRDGLFVAFARTVAVPGSSHGRFGAVFAMSADGRRMVQITRHPVAFDYYYPVQWSEDDAHILLDRTRYITQGAQAGAHFSVHVFDIATQTMSTVTSNGTAEGGAWEPY